MSVKLTSLDPFELPPVPDHPDIERDIALIAVTFALRRAQAARRALLQRNQPQARRDAHQAIIALRVLIPTTR